MTPDPASGIWANYTVRAECRRIEDKRREKEEEIKMTAEKMQSAPWRKRVLWSMSTQPLAPPLPPFPSPTPSLPTPLLKTSNKHTPSLVLIRPYLLMQRD